LNQRVYISNFLAPATITTEDGDNDKDVHGDYVDDVLLDGNWADAP
jgi:hypothetical protein